MLVFGVTLRAFVQKCARKPVTWRSYLSAGHHLAAILNFPGPRCFQEGRVCSSAAHGIGSLETSRVQTSCTPYKYPPAGHDLRRDFQLPPRAHSIAIFSRDLSGETGSEGTCFSVSHIGSTPPARDQRRGSGALSGVACMGLLESSFILEQRTVIPTA